MCVPLSATAMNQKINIRTRILVDIFLSHFHTLTVHSLLQKKIVNCECVKESI
jgi:hypothetical protein